MENAETAELTPEQRIEQKLFGEPEEEVVAEQAEEVEATDELEAEDQVEGDELEAEEGEEAEEELELHEIEIDGQVYEVPEPIQQAIMRDADYTQKSQENAQERETLGVLRSQNEQAAQQHEFLESVREEEAQAGQIDWQIKELRDYMRNNIDRLTGNDLEKVRFQIDELNVQKDGIVQAVKVKYGEFQQAAQQSREELRAKSTEVLKVKIPNWGDDTQKQATDYALSVGFTQEELDNSVDPREMQVLFEAAQYRRLKEGKAGAVRQARSAPRIRPRGRSTTSEETKRKISVRKRLNSTNDPKAKAKVLQDHYANTLFK